MLFVSSFLYAACKLAGDQWDRAREAELRNPDASMWPGVRTIGQLRRLLGEPAQVYVDGSTLITKGRSRAAGFFLRSDADVWVTVDDDVFASIDVLAQLIAVARHTRSMVAAPAILRSGKAFNFHRAFAPILRVADCAYAGVDEIGLGLAAIHRDFVEVLAKDAPKVGTGASEFPALFLETVDDGTWIGEDVFFCRAAGRAGLPVHLLCNAPVEHFGRTAKVDEQLRIFVAGDETARQIETERLAPGMHVKDP